MTDEFKGFSKKTLSFFRRLKTNNSKGWFDEHRAEYDEHVLNPSRAFVLTMGDLLHPIAPGIHADPRVNRSLFRINRDTRFSKNKSPYKTNMGLWFWDGTGRRMECSGFYFHLEANKLMLGTGIYMFSKPQLEEYRRSVDDSKLGAALTRAITSLQKAGDYGIGGEHYKRVPQGYDPNHKRADLLKHKGIYAGIEMKVPEAFFTAGLTDFCVKHYKAMAPLHRWQKKLTERAAL